MFFYPPGPCGTLTLCWDHLLTLGMGTARNIRCDNGSERSATGGKGPYRRVGASPGTPGVRLPYSPGLDGLRALAVIAVLLYHADLAWIPSGFLGVEVFFVISGYLITALLLAGGARGVAST